MIEKIAHSQMLANYKQAWLSAQIVFPQAEICWRRKKLYFYHAIKVSHVVTIIVYSSPMLEA